METIEYKGRKIQPIMRPMLVWDDNKEAGTEVFIYAKELDEDIWYPWRGSKAGGRGPVVWKHAEELPEDPQPVELTLKDISEGKGYGVPEHLIRIKL